jgi:hypothetical protein
MEKLITCSTVLYDKDISDKMKQIQSLKSEITILKKKLRYYEEPKVDFDDIQTWTQKKKEGFQIIKNGLKKCMNDYSFEYENISHNGLSLGLTLALQCYIEEALNIITKKKFEDWSWRISYEIVFGIEGFVNGLVYTGVWDLIYQNLYPLKLSKLIYSNIIWQLDDYVHSDAILYNIPVFKSCTNCRF